MTRWPTRRWCTPSPTFATVPEISIPNVAGKKRGMSLTDIDNRIKTQQDESWWKSLGLVIENTSVKELQAQLDNFFDSKNE